MSYHSSGDPRIRVQLPGELLRQRRVGGRGRDIAAAQLRHERHVLGGGHAGNDEFIYVYVL